MFLFGFDCLNFKIINTTDKYNHGDRLMNYPD